MSVWKLIRNQTNIIIVRQSFCCFSQTIRKETIIIAFHYYHWWMMNQQQLLLVLHNSCYYWKKKVEIYKKLHSIQFSHFLQKSLSEPRRERKSIIPCWEVIQQKALQVSSLLLSHYIWCCVGLEANNITGNNILDKVPL